MSIYSQVIPAIVLGVVLLIGAAVFFGALKQSQDPSKNPGHRTRDIRVFWSNLAGSLRQFGMTLTGAGTGVAIPTFWYGEFINHFYWSGALIGLYFIIALGSALALIGSVFVITDAMYFHRTGHRY
ncbi:hypothetical protein [Kocuria rosea]|uniref:hypothetical protein n=1 Tax=Kocuria rosea TaxID=1275 RepID=UPI0025423BB4|nr:hypothetical protein [Kocuria rosea]WIG19229.1 hypothetical protein QOY29_17260 [Kocuria rosea]